MLAQHLRVVIDHFVRRMAAPVSNDLTAHPGILEMRYPSSSRSVHPSAGLDQLQLPQNGMKLVLQHIRQTQRRTVSGLKEITGLSPLQVFLEFRRYGPNALVVK
jgi:hypothetical protein